jgi:ribonuclease R
MDFSIATLLSHFSDDKLVAGKALEKKLGCENEESVEALQIILDALERIGILAKERGKYKRVSETSWVEAKLRCSSKGFCFAIQDSEDADDIYVRESYLSNAWNGDRVLVKIIKEGTRRRSPEGEVKLILERANPSLLAQVKQENGDYRAVPLDDRLLFELSLQDDAEKLQKAVDHLVHISVKRYPIGNHPPIGQVTRILGSDAEEAADTDIVCCKHDLPQDFAAEAIAAAQALPKAIKAAEFKTRQDFRKLTTFTLEDDLRQNSDWIETALTLEQTTEGQWQVGLHIADVDHYIAAGSLLDKVAHKRGTTVFLGEKVLPLFPDQVGQRLSLLPGEDRLTISILLTLDGEGQVSEFELLPSVINVDRPFNLTEAQSLISEGTNPTKTDLAWVDRLRTLFLNLSPLVKAQRLKRGGFEILSDSQSPFKDEGRSGVILASSTYPLRTLLTEWVVLAQKSLADHFHSLGVPAIYCAQPQPDWDDLEDLLKLAINLKLDADIKTEEPVTSQDFSHLTQAFAGSAAARVLNFLLQGALKSVRYYSHPVAHFGLAYDDGYTHFVSPGQRYSDLVLQRILKAVFSEGRDRRTKQTKVGVQLTHSSCHGKINWNVLPPQLQEAFEEAVHQLISHLNDREKIAEDAEKDLEGLKKAEKMKARTGQTFKGLITGVQSYGFFVEIEDLLVEGLVHVSSLKDDWYEYRARHSCLVGRKNRIAYRLGDEVEVEVKSVDYYRQQIDLVTVGGGSAVSNEDWEEE